MSSEHPRTGDGPAATPFFIPHLFLPFLAGLLASPFLLPAPWHSPAALASALLWLLLRRRSWSPPILWGFMLLLGVSLPQSALVPPEGPGRIGWFAGEDETSVEAVVVAVPRRGTKGATVDLAARRVWRGDTFAVVAGGIRLYVEHGPCDLRPGDAVRFRARLKRPRLFGTPGEFDRPRHLARRGIFVTAGVENADRIVRLAGPGPSGPGGGLAAWRAAADRRIEEYVPPAAAPLVRALVLGDKSGFADPLRDLLARSGLAHLFAISGLHLGLIGLFGYAAALSVYRRSERLLLLQPPQRLIPVLLLPLLLAYLVLTGAALATRRALLMGGGASLLGFFSRRTPIASLLAGAAFLMLVLDPLALYEPGFQLSFAGLTGIILWGPPCYRKTRRWPRPWRWLAATAAVTLAANLATAPLVLFHFHLLAPAGLPANLFAVPLVGFVALPLGLSGLLLAPLWPAAAGACFRACGACLEAVLAGASALLDLPGLEGWTLYAAPRDCLALAAFAAAVLLLAKASRKVRRRQAALLSAGLILWLAPAPRPGTLTVIPLSVGQGDATLLSFPDGRHYLVDGGGMPGIDFDVGERLVTPALARLGVKSLDGVFLSHGHPDHWLGLVHVVGHLPVAHFWSGLPVEDLPPPLRDALSAKRVPVTTVPPGWRTLVRDGPLEISLFVPPQRGRGPNDRSIAVFARWDDAEALLTGDLESRGVTDLVAGAPAGRTVTFLKLPHHGSRYSPVDLLLDRFRPEAAWVSSGANNPFHFPHPEVVRLLEERGVPLYRTDSMGTLRLRPGARGPEAGRWLRGLFR